MNVRPESFDEIIGQERVKTVLKTLAVSARKTNEVPENVLIHGKSGGGKTTLAFAFASEMNRSIHTVNASTVKNPKDLFSIFKKIKRGDVVFIDEVHALTKKTSEAFYTVLEDYKYYEGGRERPLPKFCCLACTTSLGSLELPFKNRFQYIAELESYTIEQITDICLFVCRKRGFKLERKTAEIIAKTARRTPREAKNRVEWIRSYFISNDIKSVSKKELLEIIKLQGISPEGLTDMDLRYLSLLRYDSIGVNQLASKLNTDTTTLQKMVEPFLIENSYIRVTGSGREITSNGLEIIEE